MRFRTSNSLLILFLIGSVSLQAETRKEMYSLIIQRNPFGLSPEPVAAPEPVGEPEPEPIEVNLNVTGFTMRNNVKRVYFVIPATKENPNPQYLRMEENEKQGSLQVLQIDPAAGTVKVRNAGKIGVLSFESHGLKASAPAPAKASNPVKGGAPTANNPTSARASGPQIIGRGGVVRQPNGYNDNQGNPTSNQNVNASTLQGGVSANRREIPTRRSTQTQTGPNYNHGITGSGEEIAANQLIMLEAQRQLREATTPDIPFPPVPGLPAFQHLQGGNDQPQE